MEPIRIQMAHQTEGVTYALHPLSRRRILARWPDLRLLPKVFIGYTTRDEFEALHGPVWREIVLLLSGHALEELEREFGGVELYEPASRTTTRLSAAA